MNLHTVERFEKLWISLAVVMLLLMCAASAFNVLNSVFPVVRSQTSQHVDLSKLATTPFGKPQLKRLGFKTFELYATAQAFMFTPNEIQLEAGDSLQLSVTSKDVIHGLQILNTPVNIEVIPGEVATTTYTFDKPGVYLVVCNEYCGLGHHLMMAKIIVRARKVVA